jgi:hypothetical protein
MTRLTRILTLIIALGRELAKLTKLDPKLADEMDEYRKTYVAA